MTAVAEEAAEEAAKLADCESSVMSQEAPVSDEAVAMEL